MDEEEYEELKSEVEDEINNIMVNSKVVDDINIKWVKLEKVKHNERNKI